MYLLTIVIVLLIISFSWAWYSLKQELKKHTAVTHAQKTLAKGKVLFQAPGKKH